MAYDIEKNLTNHPPSKSTQDLMESLRVVFKGLAADLDRHLPDSREKSLAFTNLEQTVMWTMAALARNQEN